MTFPRNLMTYVDTPGNIWFALYGKYILFNSKCFMFP